MIGDASGAGSSGRRGFLQRSAAWLTSCRYLVTPTAIWASATPSSTLRLELVFTCTDDDNALAELTRILERSSARHAQ